MVQDVTSKSSNPIAIKLYDKWVRERQQRPDIYAVDSREELQKAAEENFRTQLVEPRKSHLEDLKALGDEMSFADKAALLAMIELPTLETSTLLHRLSRQIATDAEAPYFSVENLADNCGCGCGCGCAAMIDLSYQEQIVLHHQTKPFSIDPFNELGTPQEVRDSLLARDFMGSFETLSQNIGERINHRYHQMAREFGE